MKCVRPLTFRDSYLGVTEYKPDVSFVSTEAEVYLRHPDHFEKADERQQKLRDRELISAPLAGPDAIRVVGERTTPTTRPRRRGSIRFDKRSQQWIEQAPARNPRVRAATKDLRADRRTSSRSASDARPWDLGPTPETQGIAVLPCRRVHTPDEIGTELRSAARRDLRGIAGRTTGVDGSEIGGFLFGRRDGLRFVVSKATESGQNCVRRRDEFIPDLEHDLQVALRLYEQEGLELLGAWHTHPTRGWTALSDQDLRSAAGWRAMLGAETLLSGLVVRDQAGRWATHMFVCRGSAHGGADTLAPSPAVT